MDQNSQKFENLFRNLSGQQIETPSARVLRKLRFRLGVSDFFSFNFRKVNIIYTSVILGGIASGIIFMQKSDVVVDQVMEEQEMIAGGDFGINKEEADLPDFAMPSIIAESGGREERGSLLTAMFAAETARGCAPLHVKFYDKSVMADTWHWDFGTGETSERRYPEYTYHKPGIYDASLTITDKHGNTDIYHHQIEVLRRPVAGFSINKDSSEIAERKIVFHNTSEGASKFIWDFGDDNQSTARQAIHTYDNFGEYSVRLIAKSFHGCTDTAVVVNKFIDRNYELVFPQYFRPNPFDRNNSGLYENAGNEPFIFYPSNQGALEYSFSVYTPNGIKVFETNNIKQGWNGYIGGSLASQGTYHYIAKGIYPNGKRFEVRGEVKVMIEDHYYKF